jgi:cytochrome d ubiquinol oxidase subunit I
MSDPLFWHRLQFGFTITYHYLFPQLTMGLALLIVVMKGLGLRAGGAVWNDAARFWIRVFGLAFRDGVVTGIPMEFQFGTNWAAFSHKTGGVIGQTLAMEGIFAFFLESSFLALLVFGEGRLGPRLHALAALALFVGSWLSAYFIIATNAFMQYPVGHAIDAAGTFQIASLAAFVFSPWAAIQFLHNQVGAVVTGAFAMAAVGAYWTLRGEHAVVARSPRTGDSGLPPPARCFSTGHEQGRLVANTSR